MHPTPGAGAAPSAVVCIVQAILNKFIKSKGSLTTKQLQGLNYNVASVIESEWGGGACCDPVAILSPSCCSDSAHTPGFISCLAPDT